MGITHNTCHIINLQKNSTQAYCMRELIPCSRAILQKLKAIQLIKFPASYRTSSFITVYTRAHHGSLSWARCIQSTSSHPISLRFILMLYSHQCLSLPCGLFPSGFRPKFCTHLSLPCVLHDHLILLDFITLTTFAEHYMMRSSSLCSLLHSPLTSSLECPNILLTTLSQTAQCRNDSILKLFYWFIGWQLDD